MASVGPLLVPAPVEVGEDVSGSAGQGAAEGGELGQLARDAAADHRDHVGQRAVFAAARSGLR